MSNDACSKQTVKEKKSRNLEFSCELFASDKDKRRLEQSCGNCKR